MQMSNKDTKQLAEQTALLPTAFSYTVLDSRKHATVFAQNRHLTQRMHY